MFQDEDGKLLSGLNVERALMFNLFMGLQLICFDLFKGKSTCMDMLINQQIRYWLEVNLRFYYY